MISVETESQPNPVLDQISKFAKKGEELFCEAWKAASRPLTSFAPSSPCNRPLCPAGIFALAKLPCGVCVIVKGLELAHDKADELRRIGIREGSRISLVSSHDPMLVIVENTRIALSHDLASHVKVEALHA
jgi:Fe2+ transport system protein FeoA